MSRVNQAVITVLHNFALWVDRSVDQDEIRSWIKGNLTTMPTEKGRDRLILGSGSKTRARILRNAGVAFHACKPDFDEKPVRDGMARAGTSAADCALALAIGKARVVSRCVGSDLVIGSDQILECDGRWFGKPDNRDQAFDQLVALSGKMHRLVCGVAAVKKGRVIWAHDEQATLSMRKLDQNVIVHFLSAMGDDAMQSVGGYQIEGLGVQLFEFIEGDFFTVLGLPLFPLLGFLRRQGVIGN